MQYFAQDEATRLDPTLTVYQTLAGDAPIHMVPHIRNILGGFLFSGDDVDKPVRVLSGGERTRLAVARMLLRPSNTLLLDEPTNHLDLDSKDVLLEALEDFGGTLIFVSHDRYFVDKLATKVVDIGHGDARALSRHLRRVPVEPKASRDGCRGTAAIGASPAVEDSVTSGGGHLRCRRTGKTAEESGGPGSATTNGSDRRPMPVAIGRTLTRRSGDSRSSKPGSPIASAPSKTSKPRCPPRGSTTTTRPPNRSSTATRPSCGRWAI